ncbi:MAG TPA: PrsW family glutamic-type intramembrane protease [Vicinamibacterales bacterium]|nr:PrsW family glutamic-type intramembrane protease [Vicinamibacterales bacterium]
MVLTSLVAILPVVSFLLLLILFDSFKLVPTSTFVRALVSGVLAAIAASLLHAGLFAAFHLDAQTLARYVAPVTEEALKMVFVLWALFRRQIGFLVDAAIVGFAIGAGFAVVENIEYLRHLPDQAIWLWIVRGFGTAILHALTTAVIAIGAKAALDRRPERPWLAVIPPWMGAVLLHSAFNHALVSPLLAAAMVMFVLPLVVLAVFTVSEQNTREWVGAGLDLDMELLQLVKSSEFSGTRFGRYLGELRSRFPGPVVADMFCLLQLDLELAIRAKGMLMAREAGLIVPVDDALRARLAERAYLEKTIGRTGLLALRPLQVTSDFDRWHRHLLEGTGKR